MKRVKAQKSQYNTEGQRNNVKTDPVRLQDIIRKALCGISDQING